MKHNYLNSAGIFTFLIVIVMSGKDISAQSGWFPLNSGTTTELYSVFFTSANTGYTCGGVSGQTLIIKTTNGGFNWISQDSGLGARFQSIKFTDANTGYAAGYSGRIGKTTNGGDNWINQVSGTTKNLYSLNFINSGTGYAAGDSGKVLKTTNGGVNWMLLQTGTTNALFGVCFLSDTGFAAGYNEIVLKTTNGGINWTSQLMHNDLYALNCIYFLNSSTGYAVGLGGRMYKTTNTGLNWTYTEMNASALRSVSFTNSNTGYICGDAGIIFKTTDSGNNWFQQISNTTQRLADVHFPDTDTGYMVGSNGVMFKTTTGGVVTSIKQIIDISPKNYLLYQNYPNPFNPVTKIKFILPSPSKGGVIKVQLIIYDILGQEVASLIPPLWGGQEGLPASTYEANWDGTNYPSGVYFYKLTVKDPSTSSGLRYSETKKMILVK